MEKSLSDALSSLVNNAYTTLQKPLLRGLYLLELFGNPLEEGTQALDPEFLMKIMDINEKLADCVSETVAAEIWKENSKELSSLIDQVSQAFRVNDIAHAKHLLTKMKYYTNIDDKLKEFQLDRGLQFES